MPGLFDDLLPGATTARPAKAGALFSDLIPGADDDSFESQAARSGLTAQQAKGALLAAEQLGEEVFPEKVPAEHRGQKQVAAFTGGIHRGVASVIEMLGELSKPSLKQPVQAKRALPSIRQIQRSIGDPRYSDPELMAQAERTGLDPVLETPFLKETQRRIFDAQAENEQRSLENEGIRQERYAMDRLIGDWNQPLHEQAEAAEEVAQRTEGSEGMAKIAQGIASAAPSMAGGRYLSLGIAIGALQSGGDTHRDVLAYYKQQGVPDDEAERLATEAATSAASWTGVVTAIGGKLTGRAGTEGALAGKTALRAALKQPVRHVLGLSAKEGLAELPEEFLDQLGQSMIAAKHNRPDMTWDAAMRESMEAGLLGFISAGVMTAPMGAASLSRATKAQLSKDTARMLDEAMNDIRPRLAPVRPIVETAQRPERDQEFLPDVPPMTETPAVPSEEETKRGMVEFLEKQRTERLESGAKPGSLVVQHLDEMLGQLRPEPGEDTPPELQSPSEFGVNLDPAKAGGRSKFEHFSTAIQPALKEGKPISAVAWNAYSKKLNMTLPEGYEREGDRYVRKETKASPAEPELMEPDAFASRVKVKPRKGGAVITSPSGRKLEMSTSAGGKMSDAESVHRLDISHAFQARLPVSAAAIDTYGITLPRGYGRHGARYIFKPGETATAAEPATATPALFADLVPAPKPDSVTQGPNDELQPAQLQQLEPGNAGTGMDAAGQSAVAGAPELDEGQPAGPVAETVAGQPGAASGASGQQSNTGVGGGVQGQSGRPERVRSPRANRGQPDRASGRPGIPGQPAESTPGGNASPIAAVGAEPRAELTAAEQNHVIAPDDALVPGGDKTKARANLDAIKLLKQLEAEGRKATPDEKKILARYVGWGGLKEIFDDGKADNRNYTRYLNEEQKAELDRWEKQWGKLYDETRSTLTPEEHEAAARSILNAHYTSREVIDGIWQAVARLGFTGGRVLEPSAGVGHFFGLMPGTLAARSQLHGVELDSISGRILAKLYPQARVQVTGFEKARIPNNSMDLVVGNVPFAKDGPYDPLRPKLSLHNWFFVRGLDALKPGGLMVAITSSSTLDNAASLKALELLAEKADLVAAIRLPNNAFKKNAGTEVTTDILIFRKKDGAFPQAESFRDTRTVETGDGRSVAINEYFARHPEMMLGRMSLEGTMYGPDQPALIARPGEDLGAALKAAVEKLPERVFGTTVAPVNYADVGAMADQGAKEGQLLVKAGQVYAVQAGAMTKPEWSGSAKAVEQAKRYVAVRDLAKELIAAQFNPTAADEDIEALRAKLNKLYDDYVRRHGALNGRASRFLEDDTEFPLARALENVETISVETTVQSGKNAGQPITRKSEHFHKSEIFLRRTIFPRRAPDRADTPADALSVSLAYKNVVDPAYVGALLGITPGEARGQLLALGLVFENPQTGTLETPDDYLSGFVKEKLKAARAAVRDNPALQRNVEALEKVQPAPVPIEHISFRLGSSWLPTTAIEGFLRAVLEVHATVHYTEQTGNWSVVTRGGERGAKNVTTYGGDFAGHELIEDALNLKSPVVYDEIRSGGETKRERNPAKTLAMQEKQAQLRRLFEDWARNQPDVARELHSIYNERFNGTVLREFQGPTWDYYPNASTSVKLRPHQKAVVTRILQNSTLLAHGVGTGKTFVLITSAMEMKRLGMAKKPMLVVQNATLPQVAASFKQLYPAARVLAPSEKMREAANRQRLMSQIATGDWDAVIVPQSWLNQMPDDPERVANYTRERIEELTQAILEAKRESGKKSPKAADLQRAKERLEKRLTELQDRKVDNVLTFEQLGVDALLVDEFHAYKKLEFTTKMDSVKGLDRGASQRGFGMMMKMRFVQERNAGKNTVGATGTPISNTIAEAWTVMRFLRPDLLAQYHMKSFDDFASTFGETVTQLEMTAGGTWKPVSRFARFTNGPELLSAFHTVADVVLPEDVNLPGVPALKNGKPTTITVAQTPRVASQMKYLRERLERFEKMSGREKREHSSEPLVVFGLAKKASLDMRLVDPSLPDEPGSKLDTAAGRVKAIHETSSGVSGTQLVFADSYQSAAEERWLDPEKTVPNPAYGKATFNLYHALKQKLVARGIPAAEIEIIGDHDTDAKREALFKKVNDGKVRVLIGSTEKMGVGVNVQRKLVALHHLDAPPRPMDVEQRAGRILRQGNENPEAEILTYGVENTLDAAMFQKLATKQKFINQILRGELTGRNFDDAANEISMTFEEQMAAFSGDPLTLEKVSLENQVRQLQSLKHSHQTQVGQARGTLEQLRTRGIPEGHRQLIQDAARAEDFEKRFAGEPTAELSDRSVSGRKEVAAELEAVFKAAIAETVEAVQANPTAAAQVERRMPGIRLDGVPVELIAVVPTDYKTGKADVQRPPHILWKFAGERFPRAVTSGTGFLASVRSAVDDIVKRPTQTAADLAGKARTVSELSGFVEQPFEREAELQEKQQRLAEVTAQLVETAKAKEEVEGAAKRVEGALMTDAEAAKQRLASGEAYGNIGFLGLKPAFDIVRDLAIVGMDYVRRGYATFGAWSKAMVARFGSRVKTWLDDAWQRVQNIQGATAMGLTPDGVAAVNRIEAIADGIDTPPPVKPVNDGKMDSFFRRLGPVSRRLHYFGSEKLLRSKQELDLQESYMAAAVREQSGKLLKMMTTDAYEARPTEFKLPKWMNLGAWATRLRRFRKLALPIAAHLNATGKDAAGNFVFTPFEMRAGLMPTAQFTRAGHSIGDVILVQNPLTGEMQELTIGAFIDADNRRGYQLTRAMSAAQQQELYDYFRNEYPELAWVTDIYIDPDLADVRYNAHGVEVPMFNRFALAAKMAERNPTFTAIDAYTPDVLVTRSLLGAVRGALGLRRGTRSPGRKYKTGRAREGGEIRDLFSGFNIRTFQALQENARQRFVKAVFDEATPIKGGVVPEGYVKLDTGIDEIWNAVKRLRSITLPVDMNGQPLFPETEARLQDDGSAEFKAFFGEAAKLRGKQLMLPQPLLDMLLRKYAAMREHGRLYRLGAWLVRNSTQLFLAHPKTYVANVLTNDMFTIEAAYRYALAGGLKLLASPSSLTARRNLRVAGNLLSGMALNRFKGLRELLHVADQTHYLRTVREVLPDAVFADATQLADVKVRYDDRPLDLLRRGEVGAAVLNGIQYGAIDVRAKQRLAYSYLKANAVTAAKAAGLSGPALRAAVDAYMAKPPQAARLRAVAAANFEYLNYADTPEWLQRFSQNDFTRLILPFPRFGYHFLSKQAARLSGLKLFLGKVPRGQRAEALADLITVSTFGLGLGGVALHAAVRALFGHDDDDDDPRKYIGTSTVKFIGDDGEVKTVQMDRELITANRVNLSYMFRSLGLDSDREEDFWLRVRQYPVVTMAGAALLAQHDAKKFGASHGVTTYINAVTDLGSDFFSLGMAVKVPDKLLAELRSLDRRDKLPSLTDPYATRVPFTAYLTEQAMDSFLPGSRQADEVLMWLDPVSRRRTASKELGFEPGVWTALRTSHVTGIADRLFASLKDEETSLPAAGRVETAPLSPGAHPIPAGVARYLEGLSARMEGGPNARVFLPPLTPRGHQPPARVAFVPERNRRPVSTVNRLSSLAGFNLRPVPREDYEEAVARGR